MLAYDWSLGSLAGEWVECGFDYLFKEREYNSGRPLLINTSSATDRISAAGDEASFCVMELAPNIYLLICNGFLFFVNLANVDPSIFGDRFR